MRENRKNLRYYTTGLARINGVKKDFSVKNISVTGCCLECPFDFKEVKINEKYMLDVKPERSSHIRDFNLEVECRWIRSNNDSCEIGFQITASPGGKCFQSYVDYITYHSVIA